MRSARAFLARVLRATRLLVKDERVPRPLRWLAGLALLPFAGPFDEVVLLVLAAILFAFHRAPMREAWRDALARPPDPPDAPATY